MRKRKSIKYFTIVILIIGLSYIGYRVFRNYQRNEIITESSIDQTYSDLNSKFNKHTYSDSDFEFNNSLLKSIGEIKDSVIVEFLNKTEEKILFSTLDKDTLNIEKVSGQNFTYLSTLDKGHFDKKFNDLLFNSLKPLLSKNGIDEIQVYTLTPTKFQSISPPPGSIANFEFE